MKKIKQNKKTKNLFSSSTQMLLPIVIGCIWFYLGVIVSSGRTPGIFIFTALLKAIVCFALGFVLKKIMEHSIKAGFLMIGFLCFVGAFLLFDLFSGILQSAGLVFWMLISGICLLENPLEKIKQNKFGLNVLRIALLTLFASAMSFIPWLLSNIHNQQGDLSVAPKTVIIIVTVLALMSWTCNKRLRQRQDKRTRG